VNGLGAWDPGYFVSSLGVGIVSGLVPFVNIEVYIAGMAALSKAPAASIIASTTLGQMIAKAILYHVGRGAITMPWLLRAKEKIHKASESLHRHEKGADAVVLLSAITGFPPFYAVSVAAGMLNMSFWTFMAIGTFGRILRFSVVFYLPRYLAG
jgi:membrane protein YqaA with SNARE-associated domain